MDRPNRYLEIPPGPDPSLSRPIDLTVPHYEPSPVVREALEQARARVESTTAQAKQQILSATAEVKQRVEQPAQPDPVAKLREVESKPLELPEPKQEQPLWKRILGGIVNILDAPGRTLTQASLGMADVAKQVWERGHPVEKIVGIPVLAAGAFVVGAMGGVASFISPKAWYETAVALSKPRETLAGLKETIAENPFRAAAIAGALVAPVKLPKLAGVGIVERVRLVPERLKAAIVSEAGALAKVEAVWPAKTWKAVEAEAELARRGLAKAVRAEPEQMAQLERASKASEYVMGELAKRTYVKLEQQELPARYEVTVKDPTKLFKNYEAFIEITGKTEVLGRRIGRIPESLDFEVRGEGWARALREKFDWSVYERRVYAKDVEQVGFKKAKEFETFERLAVKGERFEYKARIIDPEVVLEKIPAKPTRPLRQLDELLRAREIQVVRPIPGPPGITALAYIESKSIAKVPQAEAVLERVKPSTPTAPNIIEVPRLRELPVRADVDAIGHIVETNVRLGVQPPAPSSVLSLAHLPTLSRGSETVHKLHSTPALDIVGIERFSIDTISSLGLSRESETVPRSRLTVGVRVGPETPSPVRQVQQLVAEGVTLPRLKPEDVVGAGPRLEQPDVPKQVVAAEARPVLELLKPLGVRATLGPRIAVAQASEPRSRASEILDVDVKTLERMGFDIKQVIPPELAEPGVPALPPAGRAPARTSRIVKQELRIPSLSSELRKLRLARWEWELPEWGKGLRKLLEPSL
jgi:hypothetical protein